MLLLWLCLILIKISKKPYKIEKAIIISSFKPILSIFHYSYAQRSGVWSVAELNALTCPGTKNCI
jgi:hypothetical protein